MGRRANFLKNFPLAAGLFAGWLILCISIWGCHRESQDPLADIPQVSPSALPVSQGTQTRKSVNNDITISRHNAITRSVMNTSPAVVGINVVQIRRYVTRSPFDDPFWNLFFQPQEYQEKVKSLGSGFMIAPDGYILTNEHVIHQAAEIVVTMTDGKQYEAKSIGEDQTVDVAVLKIEGKDFPFIPLGDSEEIIIGEWVIALGNPFGLFDVGSQPTVTVGVVSAMKMDFGGQSGFAGRSYKDMIQTDASINTGNSGGPLVNSLGRCIGINTFILSSGQYSSGSVGIGFAIPINRVKEILPELKDMGYVDRSFQTGLEVENISWLVARMLNISTRDGVVVSRVKGKSPADRAGVKVGDVIIRIAGQRIQSTDDVQRIINAFDVRENTRMQITIYREGEVYEFELTLETE